MEFMECLLSRRSGRKYTAEPVSEEALEEILKAGLLAPSGRNLKPVRFYVIWEPGFLSEARAMGSAMMAGASRAIVVLGDSAVSDTWVEDGSIAMTQMMLRATDLGVANCWVQGRNRMSKQEGVTTEDFLREKLGFPENQRLVAMLALGMPAEMPSPHDLSEADFGRVQEL